MHHLAFSPVAYCYHGHMVKKITLVAAASVALLTGCSAEVVPGLSLNSAPDYGNRGDITVSAEVLNGSEHNGYKAQTGKLRIFQDGQEINSAKQSLEAKTNYYRLTSADNHELAGKVIQVAVYADNPNDVVKCGIKVTGEEEPVHHVEQAEGKGAAYCQVKLSSGPFQLHTEESGQSEHH